MEKTKDLSYLIEENERSKIYAILYLQRMENFLREMNNINKVLNEVDKELNLLNKE